MTRYERSKESKSIGWYIKWWKNNDDDKILKIKFEQKNIEKIIEMKDAKFINNNNITIKNVGNISAHKLYFIKNKEISSNDFCFFGKWIINAWWIKTKWIIKL